MNEIMNCMQCGFCLPACPTYRQTGKETASPRGRIALMKGVAQESLTINDEFEHNMYLCLGCRACETACPAGVPYGSMLETAREVVETNKKQTKGQLLIRKVIFDQVFPSPARLKTAGTLLWTAQATGMQKLAVSTGLVNILPKPMAEMQAAIQTIASPMQRRKRLKIVKSTKPKATLRVGLFLGCMMDVLFYEINQATARVLAKAGCDVEMIENQVCCGALHAHAGEKAGAIELAKRNIEAFERSGVDYLVNNAGGCGAALKEYHHWFHDDPAWMERAMNFVSKQRDINEILTELPPLTFDKPLNARVTYQDSCHLAHGQGIRIQPRDLIKSIPGVTYVEMNRADSCCGSAGIYNITNYEMSMDILDDKMENVKETQPNYVVTSNPGCLIQMKHGVNRAGVSDQMEAVHIVELLDRALS
nr:(Fe-S)-binding protein [Brevibacillus dissolubilis]